MANLHVKCGGKTITFDFNPDDTILTFKFKLHHKEGVILFEQVLYKNLSDYNIKSKPLENDKTFSDYNIKAGSTIYLWYRPNYYPEKDKLNIATLTRQIFNFDYIPNDTIINVKRKIQDLEGILPEQQQLIFGPGISLKDDKTLIDYGINTGATLHCVILPKSNNDNDNDDDDDEKKQKQEIETYIISTALILVVCITSYDYCKDLPGTQIDKQNMYKLWHYKYKFEVIQNNTKRVDYDDFNDLINDCRSKLSRKQNKNKYDALFIIYSGHGDEDNIILSDSYKYNRDKLMEYFNGNNVPFMSNKPKIIIMDACRGNKDVVEAWPVSNNNTKNKSIRMKGPKDNQHHPDEQFIVLYATTKGYQVPDGDDGGNVIKTIYDIFNKDSNINKYHLDDLFKITQKEVKQICNATQCIEQRNYGNDSHIYLKK
eukprot:232176_1